MLSRKSVIYIIGLIGLGFIIFNNITQSLQAIKNNINLILSLILSLSGSILYGVVNLNRW